MGGARGTQRRAQDFFDAGPGALAGFVGGKCTPMPCALLLLAPAGVIQATLPAIGYLFGSSISDRIR
jgi:hypothetical protein